MNFHFNGQSSFDEIVSVRYNCFPTIVYLYQHRFCTQIFIVFLLLIAPTNYLNDRIFIMLNLFSLYLCIHWFIYFFSYPPFSLLLNYNIWFLVKITILNLTIFT